MEIKIEVPLRGLDKYQKETQLKELYEYYNNKYDFIESKDDMIHFDCKYDNVDNIFGIIINVDNSETRYNAQERIYNIIEKYKIYDDCEFIWLPSNTQENQVVKLSNTTKIVDLLF
jgi:hypothetical protein